MKKTVKILAALLLMVMAFSLVACGPASYPTDAKEVLEANGYAVVRFDAENEYVEADEIAKYTNAGITNIESVLLATSKNYNIVVLILEEESYAKTQIRKLQNYVNANFEYDSKDTSYRAKQNGRILYYGTDGTVEEKAAVNAYQLAALEGVETIITGTKTAAKNKDSVNIAYFKDKATAAANLKAVQAFAGADFDVKQDGKILYFGTDAGIEASR